MLKLLKDEEDQSQAKPNQQDHTLTITRHKFWNKQINSEQHRNGVTATGGRTARKQSEAELEEYFESEQQRNYHLKMSQQ